MLAAFLQFCPTNRIPLTNVERHPWYSERQSASLVPEGTGWIKIITCEKFYSNIFEILGKKSLISKRVWRRKKSDSAATDDSRMTFWDLTEKFLNKNSNELWTDWTDFTERNLYPVLPVTKIYTIKSYLILFDSQLQALILTYIHSSTC